MGKTRLAVGLDVNAVEREFSAQFYRFDELLNALKADAHLPPVRLRRNKYLSTALLVIDELGFEPIDREEASLFFQAAILRCGWTMTTHHSHCIGIAETQRFPNEQAIETRYCAYFGRSRSLIPAITNALKLINRLQFLNGDSTRAPARE